MIRFGIFLLVGVVLAGCMGKKNISLKTDEQKASYALGQQIGQGMKSQGLNVDPNILSAAIEDVMADRKSRLSDVEMRTAMMNMQKKMQKDRTESSKVNKEKGAKFLEENKKKKGIKVTKSGLQYEVLTEGKGKTPTRTSRVKVHYKGTLLDSSEFDSSYKRDKPAEFSVGGVIKGWTEGLQLMKEGGKNKFYIPSDLAYGPMGRPGIPPNSMLTFEVELVEIVKATPPPPTKIPTMKPKKKPKGK